MATVQDTWSGGDSLTCPVHHTLDVKAALLGVWEARGGLFLSGLPPSSPSQIVAVLKLKRHGGLKIETEKLLLQLSPATIPENPSPETLARPHEQAQIPVRTFAGWDESQLGFLEVDLVAHCGESTKGKGGYLHPYPDRRGPRNPLA